MFDKLPPHSADAEHATLGCCLMDREAWEACAPLVVADSFFSVENGMIWSSLDRLYKSKKGVDALIVYEDLKRQGQLDEVGGGAYIGQLVESVTSGAPAVYYAEIVAEKYKLRELIKASSKAQVGAYACESAEDIAASLEAAAAEVRNAGRINTIQAVGEVAKSVMAEKRQGKLPTIRTGLNELDDFAGGLLIGGTTMIAGKPGMGKSQGAKQIAYNIAGGLVHNQPAMPVGIISIEETAGKIATNYISQLAQIVNDKLVYNRLNADELAMGDAAADNLDAFGIYIDDAQCKLTDIQRVARRMAKKYGCRVIIVDHIHLIDGETDATREQELSRISSGLKSLWKELNVAGVELLQMNRGGDRDCLPELDHLRGSGSLEADGDVIMQLYRKDYFEWKKAQASGESFTPDHHLAVFVNKNKNGPVGKVDLYFDGDHQTVKDWPDAFATNSPF